jgi:hypothetical protein
MWQGKDLAKLLNLLSESDKKIKESKSYNNLKNYSLRCGSEDKDFS